MSGRRALAVCLAALLALSAATAGVVVGVPDGDAPAVVDGADSTAQVGSDANVSVTFDDQTVYGINVTVESVTVPEDGYVLIRNSSDPNGTIIGYQNVYAGTTRNVSVPLYEGPAANQPMEAVTPWATLDVEANTTETWTATVHLGDYDQSTVDDVSASDTATVTAGQYAEVTFDDKSIGPNAESIPVERAYLPDGGYVYVSGQEGYGLTDYLPAGTYENLSVPLERSGRSGEYEAEVVRYLTPGPLGIPVTNPYYADGSEVNDTAHVTVGEPPTPYPHLEAADDRVLNSSETATLSGAYSSDDSTPFYSLDYHWEQVSGPPVHLEDPNTTTTEFTAPAVPRNTTLTFELTATDDDWNTNSTTLDVYVRPAETAEANASFAVSNLNAPAEAPPDETTVSASVTNVGEETATQTVEYRIDTDGDGSPDSIGVDESVTLAPGETREVTFAVPTEDLPGGTSTHGVFSAGVGQTAELDVPPDATFYQVDFVAGEPMELDSDSLYADEDRLVRWLLGNTATGVTDRGTAWANASVRECVDAPHVDRDGDSATITFSVADECEILTMSLVTYTTPPEGFSRETADQQELFDATTETVGPGEHTLTVPLPTGNETATTESVRTATP